MQAREVKCDMMSCESGRLYLFACVTEEEASCMMSDRGLGG